MLDVPAIELVIAVPKISLDRVPQRSALRRPQKAEQLVEVPTEPGYSLAVIAVRALGRKAATSLAEQIVNNPVAQGRRRRNGSPQGSLPGRGSTANVEQIVAFPARGGLQVFLPGQGSSSRRFLQDEDEGFRWVFSHFSPSPKKCEGYPPVESESARQCQLIRAER